MKRIAVIGSCSMDFVVSTRIKPQSGETVMGDTFISSPGGKGANQAVAASRLGAEVYMIGCVGDDLYGQQIIANLKNNAVHTDYMNLVSYASSGTAHITLEPNGENSIIVVQGANTYVSPLYVEKARRLIESVDIILIQQEIPAETVEYACKQCHQLAIPIILNPAPSRPIEEDTLEHVSFITPNELEALFLSDGASRLAFLKKYPEKCLITEGKNGVSYWDGTQIISIPAYEVKAVDTTGAGDTFNGALAVALTEGKAMKDSLYFSNAAAALSVTQLGAQSGMPSRLQIDEFLAESTTPITK